MSFKLTSSKIVSAIVLIVGISIPSKIVRAANSNASLEPISPKQEIKKILQQAKPQHKNIEIPKFLLSKKAREIEFFAFLSTLGFGIVVPELLYRNKNNDKSLKSDLDKQKRRQQIKNIEPENSSLNVIVIPENTKTLSLVDNDIENLDWQEDIELEDSSDREQNAA